MIGICRSLARRGHVVARLRRNARACWQSASPPITSAYFLDKRDETVRAYVASQADLLCALRLPKGAFYLHLDADLSGEKSGYNGRHPLPPKEALAQRLVAAGVSDDTQVAAYDGSGGMYAARLWWLLRWLGHGRVAVLDGGFAAWRTQGFAVETAPPSSRPAGRFSVRPSLVATVDRDAVLNNLGSGRRLLLDARAPERFRGENETLDPVGGHIPGARNRLFRDNLDAEGRFKSATQLRAEFATFTEGRRAEDLVSQCGSGVTACHNLLALEIAGLPGAALYPGSWSEWCAHRGAPIAVGA